MNKLIVSLLVIALLFVSTFAQHTSGPSSAWATSTTGESHKSPAVHDGGHGSGNNIDINADAQLGDALNIHARVKANVDDSIKAKVDAKVRA